MIKIKRVYEDAKKEDGIRILVDRLWPRGVSKEFAKIEEWMKDIGPSDELRNWFSHDPEKWKEFKKKYEKELVRKKDLVEKLRKISKEGTLTPVYSAKDELHNQAVVLKEFLEKQ